MAQGDGRIDERAMQQLQKQRVDANVTFIGCRAAAGKLGGQGGFAEPDLIVWIARHSVLPDKPQMRSATLIENNAPASVMIDTFIQAVLPAPEKNLAPILPGRIEVADDLTAQRLRDALAPLPVMVEVAAAMPDMDAMLERLRFDLQHQLAPLAMWDCAPELKRDLATAVANFFRRDPWAVLHDVPAVAVMLNRYGVETMWFSLILGENEQQGILIFLSEEDYQRHERLTFALAQLHEAGDDPDNLDMPDEDVELVRQTQQTGSLIAANAFTIFYMDASSVGPALLKEMQDQRIPIAGRDAIPHIMRIVRDGTMRRPDDEEIRALRLGLDAFNYFFTRHHQELMGEQWHFKPISSMVQPKEGRERIPITVSVTSPAPTFDPALEDVVFRLRVYVEDDRTSWREIEMLAQQPLMDLDTAIRDAFDWPSDLEGIFMVRDVLDGDDNWESLRQEDILTSDAAPIGLLVQKPRDFCRYMFDALGEHVDVFVRLRSVGQKDPAATYPQTVASHGDPPAILFAEDEANDLDLLFDDDDDDDVNDDDDDDEDE